jgi:predicted alpha/beta-fold hydrolase
MPLIEQSSYQAPVLFKNGHAQSIFPYLCRFIRGLNFQRERIATHDGDFLDLDWARSQQDRLIILSHGLEGCSQQSYMRGMARAFVRRGWDALAWNFRGCSGQVNHLLRAYHSGATDDLGTVIQHALQSHPYKQVVLIGFSLGGNLTLKYVGEQASHIDKRIKACITFSVPCNLQSSAEHLSLPSNRIYLKRFLKQLSAKVVSKAKLYPDLVHLEGIKRIRTFKEFDDRFTAPWHGFLDAMDYWEQCSSENFLSELAIPSLLVNAKNDPFLPEACYPAALAQKHQHFHFEMPHTGGHVGFISFNRQGEYWSEQRACAFVNHHC